VTLIAEINDYVFQWYCTLKQRVSLFQVTAQHSISPLFIISLVDMYIDNNVVLVKMVIYS